MDSVLTNLYPYEKDGKNKEAPLDLSTIREIEVRRNTSSYSNLGRHVHLIGLCQWQIFARFSKKTLDKGQKN